MIRALRAALLAVAGLFLLVGAALLFLATPPGRAVVASLIERAVSGDGLSLAIEGPSGWPPFSFGAERIVAADDGGAFAEIGGLRLELSVGALLAGRLSLDALAADRVVIARLPVLPSAAGDGDAALLPLAAQRFEITRLELGPALAGHPAALSASGGFAVTGDGGIAARLEAARTDGRLGTLDARLDRASAGAPIMVDAAVEEAADGILVGLMGRAAGPAYRLVARTGIDEGAFDGALSLTSDGNARFSGRFSLAGAGDARRLKVEGEGDLAELVPHGLADLLSGAIRIAVDIEWRFEPGRRLPRIVIRDGRLATAAIRGEASGSFGGAATDLTFRLAAERPGGGTLTLPIDGAALRFASLDLSGRIAPSGGITRLDLIGRAAGLAVADSLALPAVGFSLAIEAEGDDPLADRTLSFAFRAEADAIDIDGTRIPGGARTPLVLAANGSLDVEALSAETTADLDIAGGRVRFAGPVDVNGVAGRAEAHFADAAAIAALAGFGLAGELDATAEGRFAGRPGLDLAVAGSLAGRGLAGIAAKLVGDTVTFSGRVTETTGGRIAVAGLALTGAALSLTGDASLDDGAVEADLAGRIADLGLIAANSSGAVGLTAKLSGPVAAPRIDATVGVAEGRLLGQAVAGAEIRFAGGPAAEGWRGALTLGGSLAGLPLSGTAEASVGAAGAIGLANIDLTVAESRITGALGAAGDGLITGTVEIAAANLKPLASLILAEIDGAATLRATFTPEGATQGLAIAFAGRGIGVDDVSAGEANGTVRIDDLFGAPRIAGDADFIALTVGTVAIDTASATAAVEGGATRFEATAAGPELDLRGSGTLLAGDGQVKVTAAALSGTAFGLPVELGAPATLSIADGETRVAGVRLLAGGGTMSVEGLIAPRLDLALTAEAVAAGFVNELVPELAAEGSISGSAAVTGTTGAPVIDWRAEWVGLTIPATRAVGLPPLALAATGRGSGASTTVNATATGGLSLEAAGTVPYSGEGVDVSVEARSTGLDLGQELLARLFSGETVIAARVETGPAGRIALSDLSVGGSTVTATGALTLDGAEVDGSFAGRLADLSVLAAESEGAAGFTAKVSGALAVPQIDATVSVAEGRLLGEAISGASVRFEGAPEDGGWRGALTLAGSFAGLPLSGSASVALAASGGLTFPGIDLNVGENRIAGAIERTAGGLLAGSLDVTAPSLRALAALVLTEATGTAEGRVSFTPDNGRQTVTVAFSGRDIAMPTLAAARVDGEIRIDDALGVPQVQGHAEGTGIAAGTIRIDTARATAIVEGGATRFEATAKGPELDLAGAGSIAGEGGAEVIRLDRLTGQAFGFPVETAGPASIRIEAGRTLLSGVSLALGGGRVSADGTLAPALDLRLAASGIAASFVDRFVPALGAAGTISGSASATGTGAAPRIAWQIDWTDFSVADSRNAGLPGVTLAAKGVATPTATTVEASFSGSGLSLAVTGRVPYSGPGLELRTQGSAPLDLVVDTSADIAFGGTVRIDIRVTGSLVRPSVNGTFDLIDAKAADASDGIGIAAINGRVRFNGETAQIERFSARLTQGGDLAVTGSIAVDPGRGFPANLTIRIRNGRYLDGVMINASFDADLTLLGPVTGGATIAGRVDLGRTEILLPDSFGGGPPITVHHIHVEPGFVPPMETIARPEAVRRSAASGAGGGFNLDVALNSRSGIFVRGFGLDAELGGAMRITGSTEDLRPVGGFQMRRGRIELLGRRFDFSRGTLTFVGDLEPTLDFAATTTTADLTVTVLIAGPAYDPEISLTSVPYYPEEEIVSRLLFGRSIGALSPLQAVQLVDAVAQFSGAYGRDAGLFARVRRLVGVDDLDIQQDASGGTVIGIGKRITDTVRLGVETETSGTSRVTLDVDLTKNLKAKIEGGADGSGKVGITYEREY